MSAFIKISSAIILALLGLILLTAGYSLQGANVVYPIRDFTTSTNLRKAVITPLSTPSVYGTNIIQSDRLTFTNISNGEFTVTNMVGPVTYRVELIGPFTTTTFTNLIPDTNVTINAKDYISTTISPGATVGYSQTAIDTKFRSLTNVLYVAKSGNDSTGIRNRLDKPFLSTRGANSNAVTGDVIQVYPGAYNEIITPKANLFFQPGAKLHYTATPPDQSILSLMDDTNGAIDISIAGYGEFINQSGLTEGDSLRVITITNALSKFSMHAKSLVITNAQVGGPNAIVMINDCARFHLVADRFFDAGGNSSADAVHWKGGDNVYFNVKDITVVGNGIWEESPANTATPINMYVEADLIDGGETAVYASGANTNAVTWVRAKLLVSTTGNTVSTVGAGKVYIHAQKIWGKATASPVIGQTAGKTWITADKITSEKMPYLQVSGGTIDITAQQYEDTHGTVTNGISTSGGTTTVHGGRIDATGYAVHHSGGTLKISNAMISSQTNSGILVAGSGLTLKDCTITAASGQASITAHSAQNVTIDGTLTVNSAPSANITFRGGTLIVISNQTVYGNLTLATLGRGLQIKAGNNATFGTATLSSGTVTVNNTAVTANSVIFFSRQSGAVTPRGVPEKGTVVAGTSFVINSRDLDGNIVIDDSGSIGWIIIEPAP